MNWFYFLIIILAYFIIGAVAGGLLIRTGLDKISDEPEALVIGCIIFWPIALFVVLMYMICHFIATAGKKEKPEIKKIIKNNSNLKDL